MAEPKISIPSERIAEFCVRHRVRRLALFGSVLREDFGAESDVDVLIEFEPGVRIGWDFFLLQEELSGILGRKVDLNTRGFLREQVLDEALRDAVDVYVAA